MGINFIPNLIIIKITYLSNRNVVFEALNKLMKTGYSEVHSLLVGADRIAEDALQMLEFASKNSLAHAIYLQLGGNSAGNAHNTQPLSE